MVVMVMMLLFEALMIMRLAVKQKKVISLRRT